jgi:hypothetical protein
MRKTVLVSILAMAIAQTPISGCAPEEADGVCQEEDRAVPVEVNVDLEGEGGSLVFQMLSLDPEPVDLGANDWTVRVSDPAGVALEGCALMVTPWMPDHGHGSNEPEGVAGSEAGQYFIEGIEFIMPGYWTASLSATCGEVTDNVILRPCIEG